MKIDNSFILNNDFYHDTWTDEVILAKERELPDNNGRYFRIDLDVVGIHRLTYWLAYEDKKVIDFTFTEKDWESRFKIINAHCKYHDIQITCLQSVGLPEKEYIKWIKDHYHWRQRNEN